MRWPRGRFITSWPEPTRPVVYFVSAGGLTKIGRATRLLRRLTDLSRMSAAPLMLEGYLFGDSRLEAALHRHFDAARQHGEWFRQSLPLRALLNRMQVVLSDEAAIERIGEEFFREPESTPPGGWLRTGADRLVPIPKSLLPWTGPESRSQFGRPVRKPAVPR